MVVEFQKHQVSIGNESIKANYLFKFFPVNHEPVTFTAQVISVIPDQSFVSREDAIEAALWEAATAKLEELEENLQRILGT